MAWHIELVGGPGDGQTAEIEQPIPEIHVPTYHVEPPLIAYPVIAIPVPIPGPVLIYRHAGVIRAGVLIYRYAGEHA